MEMHLPLISTLCIVISAMLVTFGWYCIKKGNRVVHQRLMTASAAFAVLFLAIYISRTIFIGNTSFGGPEGIKPFYTGFLLFHIILAAIGLWCGTVTIIHAVRGRFMEHKKWAPWAAVIWFCAAITGILVYMALYIFWEPGPTTNMIKAILG